KGTRTDFGYIGDIGALPVSLNALVENPGGYTTWDGPYIIRGADPDGFNEDAWHVSYTYTDTLIRSTGSGSDIDKVFAGSSALLLNNTVKGFIVDADKNVPGTIYRDSIIIWLTYPDGLGNLTTATANPDWKGNFSFSNIPIGSHVMKVICIPDSDTVSYPVSVVPQSITRIEIVFPADLW
ncbi:MAG: hypothetical protein U9R56_06015, partial [candidate division Zixibacteria bacterium]|nr:hypothetical protein [candidate division Zixibacteria bacterium]